MSTTSTLDLKALDANKNIVSRNYWKDRLAEFEPNIYFPWFQTISEPMDRKLTERAFSAPSTLYKSLHSIASSDKAKHVFLMAITAIFAEKYSSVSDVAILTPVYTKKNASKTENNIIPFRATDFSEMNFQDFVSVTKDNLLRDFLHADYPVEKLQNTAGSSITDFSSVGILVENVQPLTAFDELLPDLLFCFDTDGKLKLTVKFNGAKYIRADIERMANLYFSLLSGLITNKEKKIREIALITAQEKQKVKFEFNRTEKEFPRDQTVMDFFNLQVKQNPNQVALKFQDQQLTYAELNNRANQVANYLIERFPGEGTVVGIQLERSLDLIIAIFGVLKAGYIYLPLTKNYPVERINYSLRNSNAKVVFSEPADAVYLKDEFKCITVAEALTGSDKDIHLAKPEDIAYIIYTSGSTGNPKGVLIKHRSVVNRLNWMQSEYLLDRKDMILQKTPIVFDVSIWELFWWAMYGAKLVLANPGAEKNPRELCQIIDAEKITVIHFVPSMLNALVTYLRDSKHNHSLSTIKHLFASGEELKYADAKWMLDFCPDCRIHNLYGPTEATVDVSYYEVSRFEEYIRIPIGKPIDNTQLYIFNGNLQLQPIGLLGELFIGGENLSVGYLNQPELTKQKFIENPLDEHTILYKTGDLARWLNDGSIEFFGRMDNQVKIRGNRIELDEIEVAIKMFPGIKNAIVLTKESNGVLQLVGYLVHAAEFSEEALIKFLLKKLPEYMVPAYFISVDEIPVTVNGKADRKKLLALERSVTEQYVAPETAMELKLASLWKEVLGNNKAGATDNFFRIGGDSILAIKLIGLINHTFSVTVTVIDLYENSSIRALTQLIEKSKDDDLSKKYQKIEEELQAFNTGYLDQVRTDEIEAAYPMSDIEKAMCFVHKSRPDDVLYFEQLMQPVMYERLDMNTLQKALDLLVQKHEILRTAFDTTTFAHIVYKRVQHDIIFYDLSLLKEDEQKKRIKTDLERSRLKHFDLDSAPLWRLIVYKLKDSHHELLFEYHHAVLDGWSFASMLTELNNTYGSLLKNEHVQVEFLEAGFKDYITQELFYKTDEATIDYWKQELTGYKKLQLHEAEGPKVFKSERDMHPVITLAAMERLANERNTTVKNILLAAYVYAMRTLCCENDVLVGLVTFTRPLKKDGDRILGCFLNTVPFRVQLEEEMTWEKYLNLIDKKVLEVKKYEHLSLFEINQAIGARTFAGNPLFDTFFNFINWHVKQDMNLEKISDEEVSRVDFNAFLRGNTFFDLNYDVSNNEIYCMHEYSSPFMTEKRYAQYIEIFNLAIFNIMENPNATMQGHASYWNEQQAKIDMQLKKSMEQADSAIGLSVTDSANLIQLAVEEWQMEKSLKLDSYQLVYWKNRFPDGLSKTEIPMDKPKASEAKYEVASQKWIFPEALIKKMRMYERKTGFNDRLILMTVFKLLIYKYTQQEELTIATNAEFTVSGIDRIAVPIKKFIAFHSLISKEYTVNDYCLRLLELYREDIKYQDIALDEIIKKLSVTDKKNINVLFDYEAQHSNFSKANLSSEKYDFSLVLKEHEDGIMGEVIFNAACYTDLTIQSFIDHYQEILQQALSKPNTKIDALKIITEKEKNKILFDFNDTAVAYPDYKGLMDLFDEQVKKYPDNIALKYGISRITYLELQHRSQQVASYLREKIGVQRGDLVGLIMKREEWFIPCIFGVLYAGAAYLPLDPNYPAERINTIIEDAKLKIIITREQYIDPAVPFSSAVIDLNAALDIITACSSKAHPIAKHKTDLAYVIYTSGSTGKPKGVMIEHSSVLNCIQYLQQCYPLGETDTYLLKTNYCFDVSVAEIFGWFLNGGSLVLLDAGAETDSGRIIDVIQQEGITHINFVPSAFSAFVDVLNGGNLKKVQYLKYIFLAGEALSNALVKKTKAFQLPAKLENIYGPTEGTIYSCGYSLQHHESTNKIPIGKPFPNIRLYIIDKMNQLQPVGVAGELCIAGKGLAKGYLNNKALSKEKFIKNPFEKTGKLYKTGDLVKWLPDGNIEYIGRIDDQVKIRGFRIELGDIESHLTTHDGVKEAVVVAKEKEGDKYLVAYYLSINSIEPELLRNHLAAKLPEYMVPTHYVHMQAWVLTSSGKINRKALPEPEIACGPYVGPVGDTQEKLTAIWSEILKMDKNVISSTSNFFEIGGHSLRAMVLINKIFKELNVSVSLKEILDMNTIEKIANHIENEKWIKEEGKRETIQGEEFILD
jgi:amino acid adenylation domain-containing protein